MLSHPLSYPHRYLRPFSIECGRMRVWSCLHSLFHSFWPGCRQIGQLKELIKLTTRICRTFGHFHLLYIFIIIFFFFALRVFVCLVSLLNFILSVFVGPSFCVILADMTWTVVYLLFLCASFFFWLLFILFISLTHANMFVCVCVCANRVMHSHTLICMSCTLLSIVCGIYFAIVFLYFVTLFARPVPLCQLLFIYLFIWLVFISWPFFVHII